MRRVTLDITKYVCPMTYVRTRLALESLAAGDELELLVKGDEPVRNIPKSAVEEGHEVASVEPVSEGIHRVVLRKGAGATLHV